MPRYFFHTKNGDDRPDIEGTEMADDHAARSIAVVAAGEILAELGEQMAEGGSFEMRVTNEDGAEVCELFFQSRPH